MGKAAAELAVSQPAISQAITSLERTLRVRLFDRTPQGVEPTLHGRALLKSCVAAFDDLRQGMRELEFLSDPTAGEMSIGATEPMAAGFVSAVIEQLALQHPRLTFHIVQADLSTLQDRELRPRHIELAVGRILEPSNEDDMLTEILFDDPLVVVAGRRSKWAKRPNIKFSELLGEPWVLPPFDSISGSITAEPFIASRLAPPQAQVLTFSVHLHNNLLATGQFLSLLPSSMLRWNKNLLPLRVLPVRLPVQPKPAAIVTLRGRTLSPSANLFIEAARQIAKLAGKT